MDKKYSSVILDLFMLTFGFASMSMYPDLANTIRPTLGVSQTLFDWSALAFTPGLFAAFFIGHSEFFEHNLKKGVAIATSFAAIPQLLIPYIGNIYLIIALRFLQGFVVAMVPLFSAQIGRILKGEKPLAVGIVLSGIFLGGVFGSFAAGPLNQILGWRMTFVVTGLLLYLMLLIWWIFTEEPETEKHEESGSIMEVWKSKFTWIWGFTFFPATWIVFTIQYFLPDTVGIIGLSEALKRNLHIILNLSKVFWSIIIGYVAYKLAERKTSERGVFDTYVNIMFLSYVISLIGFGSMLYALTTGIDSIFPLALFLIAGVQGVGPVFFSSPSLIFSSNMITRGGFAIALLGNSANLVAPIVTQVLKTQSVIYGWVAMASVTLLGMIVAKVGQRQELPKKK